MNSCILMAEVIQDPQLRYTQDNQTAVAEMTVQFPGLREEDPPSTLKVVGWGNLAQEIQERYHQGDRVIVEGRLTMSTVERPEGYKEKRAELTAQKIHLLGAGATLTTASVTPAATTASGQPPKEKPASKPAPKSSVSESSKTPVYSGAAPEEVAYDDIPF